MAIEFLIERFEQNADADAIVWRDETFTYGFLLDAIRTWQTRLTEESVEPGSVASLEADFSPNAVALLLALIDRACVVVPLTSSVEAQKPEFRDIAEVEVAIEIDEDDSASIRQTERSATDELFGNLRSEGHPGLVLFSSGSTGKSKASVHDFVPLLEKFKVPRHTKRCITFLQFDHIGGVNTLLYNLSNAGCVITVRERSPDAVCAAIEEHEAQILPTSPTFINLLLLSEAYRRHDLSSLELITYGTEVMPENTLRRLNELFPDVRLLQTYGLSEVGILRSKSESSDSLWVKVGGEGFETRVVEGKLEIKAESAMLGYLNAESPFTEDGWFKTGDAVEVKGEYFRFLGRTSEIINVGGEKVYPAEVENVLQQMEGVEDVAVTGSDNPITGETVAAKVKLANDESPQEFRTRMHEFCRDRLTRYKVPRKVEIVDEKLFSDRFKKMR